jgi:muramoyltetrapeptide carboxypeptidase
VALKGAPLPPGGTIGVPAPSSPYYERSEVIRNVEWWEARGYKVKLGEGIYERDAYVAGDPKLRARDITRMFADDEVDIVQTLTGGYGAAQTIPHIDFDVIRANPKAFIGYSDITALHVSISHYTDLVTLYGPGMMETNHPESTAFTQERLLKALTSTESLGEVPTKPEDDYLRAINSGKATGVMTGGCLWLIAQAMGTPWQIDLDGKIFFFEEWDTPPWYVDGFLNQMQNAGLFQNVIGVVVGELAKVTWKDHPAEHPQTLSVEDVLERYFEPLGVPTLYGLPLGHGKHLCTVPLGVTATIDADNRKLTMDEPALRQGES